MLFGRVKMKINYSQSNLQTFLTCPRKFELKYILKRIWPAIQSEPVLQLEEHIRNGKQFHLMAQQYFSGLDPEQIPLQTKNQTLLIWWKNFLNFADQFSSMQCKPEVFISADLAGKRLVGIFDLLAYSSPGKFIIIDWKTNNKKADKKTLQRQIQTRLYPFLLTLSGAQWNNNQSILPSQIEMVYWFANEPENIDSFSYSEKQFQEDKEFFINLIDTIENKKPGEFELTDNEKLCKYCQFRSLCNRGISPGNVDEEIFDLDYFLEEISEIDIEQIGEIAF
jgi:CRISPR/Cas system-associated exonuclease Cas4 (RecB family)